MTNNQLTRERLEKIKSWRDTYGAGSNVMLPAEEAEELARIALAVIDSEPVRNPVLAYADSYRDMAKQGVKSVPIWSVITDLERNIAPLYIHAQQPVVPEEKPMPNPLSMYAVDAVAAIAEVKGWNACRAAMLQAGNSPVVPDGYVMVPMRLTAENGAKGVLSGEFSETQFVNCPECFGDDECETCDGSGRIEIKVPVSWTTIKEIWIKGVEHFAAAPQENN
ncbi:TPA: hypothetical protein L0141_004927 [Klebsiella oxytoca]|uniref:hypothetical protein n=1 Tax=Klebsiella oxytoca TaxID=571 RepID=UPI0025999381|nr:hypothetical protein [Klebsiella oxytoca]MDM4227695.1 hypothetical protein [Klebsiella oxytoca]HBM9022630.1 hypothetical protein [Klebsiella oxytoca]HBM9155092.1 hypothetical protein [Klebsiella oxytoca]HBM9474671.1 hypothetical protein [Klebsiella oxytoca]HEJ8581129.1 hypothetical protein [Klebsiella oxytoca]